MKRTAKQARWSKILDHYDSADQTIAAFCRSRGIKEAEFYRWRKKLGTQSSPSAFMPVTYQPTTDHADVTIVRPSGLTIYLPSSLGSNWLSQCVISLDNQTNEGS